MLNEGNILVPREHYLGRLREARGTPFIKIITGMRRSGKSTIMKMFEDELQSSGVPQDKILHLNFDDDSLDLPKDHRGLTDLAEALDFNHAGTYVFFDEIQNVKEWEITVSHLYNRGVDVYLTGSNSNMLSSEISTRLSGRCIEIKVMPLVFSEYLMFREAGSMNRDELLREYYTYGGLPAVALCRNSAPAIVDSVIDGTYSTVFIKDIVERHSIRDVSLLNRILRYIMREVGDRVSSRSIANYLTSAGEKTNAVTVAGYLRYLDEAFLIQSAARMDAKSKELLTLNDKYYATDLGIRGRLAPYRGTDLDGIIENIVFNELQYRYEQVAVYDVNGHEIDFVAESGEKIFYYQVTQTLFGKGTFEREISPLKNIEDNHPKTIITFEQYPEKSVDGIRIVRLIDWLLEE